MLPASLRLLLVLLVFLSPLRAWADDPLAAAILNFEGAGVETTMPQTLSSIVRNEAMQIEKYQVVNQYPIKLSDLLLVLGCDEESVACMQAVAEQAKARVLIYGVIDKSGATYKLELNIFDAQTGRMINRLSRTITDTTDPIVTFRKEIETFFAEERGAAVTRLQISSSVDGARIQINETFVGVSPLERKGLPAGTYQVEVSHPDYETWTKSVRLSSGADIELWADLTARTAVVATASPAEEAVVIGAPAMQVTETAEIERVGTRNWGAWSALVVGGVALGGSAAFGIALENIERTIERESAAGTLTEGRYDVLFQRGENFELAHRVLLGAGAIAVVSGVVWFLLDDDDGGVSLELGAGPSSVNACLKW